MTDESKNNTNDLADSPEAETDINDARTLGGGQGSDTQKDPSTWVTGDEPATGAQKSYIDTLARQAGEEVDADLTKAEASQTIERLQEETGRGR